MRDEINASGIVWVPSGSILKRRCIRSARLDAIRGDAEHRPRGDERRQVLIIFAMRIPAEFCHFQSYA